MSNTSALVMAVAIVGGEMALALAARYVKRQPFPTIYHWLATSWYLIYRATGAAALDRRINRALDRRDAAMFIALAESLDGASLGRIADRCRSAAAERAARAG